MRSSSLPSRKIDAHNLYMMCKQVAKYSGAKELFAELAEEEEKHRKLREHVSGRKGVPGKTRSDF